MKYQAKHPEVDAIRFDMTPETIGELKHMVGVENIQHDKGFMVDRYLIKLGTGFMALNEGDFVLLLNNSIKVYSNSRFFEIYERTPV
jgi:hypothetical protein